MDPKRTCTRTGDGYVLHGVTEYFNCCSVRAARAQMSDERCISDDDRFWLDTMENTISLVRMIFSDRALFLMLSGAVFALHQDMLKARGVDMRKTDVLSGVALDTLIPHKLGTFPERVRWSMNALYDIDDTNLDLVQQRPAQTEQKYQAHAVSARMRSTAARVWLLTTYATVVESLGTKPSLATLLNLGVGNMWMMLGAVNADDLRENANFFTGTYFSGVRSKPMNLNHWPHRPDVVELI